MGEKQLTLFLAEAFPLTQGWDDSILKTITMGSPWGKRGSSGQNVSLTTKERRNDFKLLSNLN